VQSLAVQGLIAASLVAAIVWWVVRWRAARMVEQAAGAADEGTP